MNGVTGGITLAQAQTALAAWIKADAAVANGQSYSIGGRSLSRANAGEITQKIKYWNNMIVQMQSGGGLSMRRAVPRDN